MLKGRFTPREGCTLAVIVVVRRFGPRWFLTRDVHAEAKLALLEPRWALSYLHGPMTQSELRRALGRERRLRAVA